MSEESTALSSWISEVWPDFNAFVEDMNDARISERVTAIVGGTMLDLTLRRIIAAFLVDESGVADTLLGAEGAGGSEPLSTFSSRIKATYALGLIDRNEHDALDALRRIRNAYAHRLSDKLSEQSLTDLTTNVCKLVLPSSALAMLNSSSRQARLRSAIVSLALTLAARIKQTLGERRTLYDRDKLSIWADEQSVQTPSFN